MLVRHQRAIAGYIGGIILAAALIYGAVNRQNIQAVVFSVIGILIAIAAAWYAFRR